MKTIFGVSFIRAALLEEDVDTLKITIASFNDIDNLFTNGNHHTQEHLLNVIQAALTDKEFVTEYSLAQLDEIYFIDQNCLVKALVTNKSGKVLQRGVVATIRVK